MIPPLPPPTEFDRDGGVATLMPRYEDIVQDGRMQLHAFMPGLGAAIWRELLSKVAAASVFRAQGILPILRRLVIVGEDRPASVSVPVHYEGSFRFAREKGGERLFLNMWVEARAAIATTIGPNPPSDAPLERVGRVFAEHVITRPFAPPGERKVTRLDAPGVPPVPDAEHVFDPTEALIEGLPLADAGDIFFGTMHTDSNQHVNSLVYPRVFEELAVRQLAPTPLRHAPLLARSLDIRWRKPFFAGQRAQVRMHAPAPVAGATTLTGAFFGDDDPKPHTTLQLILR
ncbi:MAG TPA: hypothetical protein VLT33_43450 [Labilithrix sp.]|nr:hypothetical protein [Labilithrix sp.]